METKQKELNWFEKLPDEEDAGKRKKTKKGQSIVASGKRGDNASIEVHLDKFASEAHQWIEEISVLMKTEHREDVAWNSLRGVLHALRDRMTIEEVFHLSAQLPMLIRGLLFEGYKPGDKPEKYNLPEMERRIEEFLIPDPELQPELAFKAVLRVLYNHISEGQLNDMYAMMPKDIRRLWDRSLKTYRL